MLDFGGSNSGLWPPELCVCFVGFVVLSRIEKLREVPCLPLVEDNGHDFDTA